ncbi:hypothetical protein GA0115240_16811, partial [Streptomyces sp. DvalAA-14]
MLRAPAVAGRWARFRTEDARKALAGAVLIGVVSGMRSQLGVAAVALTTDGAGKPRPAPLLADRRVAVASATAT